MRIKRAARAFIHTIDLKEAGGRNNGRLSIVLKHVNVHLKHSLLLGKDYTAQNERTGPVVSYNFVSVCVLLLLSHVSCRRLQWIRRPNVMIRQQHTVFVLCKFKSRARPVLDPSTPPPPHFVWRNNESFPSPLYPSPSRASFIYDPALCD